MAMMSKFSGFNQEVLFCPYPLEINVASPVVSSSHLSSWSSFYFLQLQVTTTTTQVELTVALVTVIAVMVEQGVTSDSIVNDYHIKITSYSNTG